MTQHADDPHLDFFIPLPRRWSSALLMGLGRRSFPHPFSAAVLVMPAIGLLGLVLLRSRSNRRAWTVPALMLMLFVLLLFVGCGGGAMPSAVSPTPTPTPSHGATPAGTYLISIIGTDSNHNQVAVATIPLNVQ